MSDKPKKKILIIGNSKAFTGAFKASLQEAKALSPKYEVVFIIPSGSVLYSVLEKEGYRYYELPMMEIGRSFKKILLYFPVLWMNMLRLTKILRKESIDVIHVNDYYNLLGASVKLLGYRGRLITHVRILPSARPSFMSKWWTIIAQRYSDWVVCVSNAVLQEMPSKKNTIRIYNAISFEEKIHTMMEQDPGIVLLLYLSNYIRGKGLEYGLYAFAEAYKENPSLRLKFVGGDMNLEKNKVFRDWLINEAILLGVSGVVTFAGFSENVEKEIKESDIVLNFSEAESFSMTCAEASYYGKPVIATRCGGPEEIIEHNCSGLLVENRNVREMKEAILRLSSNKYIREEMGKTGRRIMKEKFTETLFEKEFSKLFEEILHEG